MDISDVESCELNVEEPIDEAGGADFHDIDDPEADVDESEVGKLAVQLANQLVQFQGCCHNCHGHSSREHADEQEPHRGLQTFLGESKDEALFGCSDVLGSN